MKFRDFVDKNGEEGFERIKFESNIEIIPDEITEYTIGFNLSKKDLKRIFDYIRSWYIRYKVQFEPINPYLNMFKAEFKGTPIDSSTISYELDKIETKPFDDGNVIVLREDNDSICIEYNPNEFVEEVDEVLKKFGLDIKERTCYVKIISTDKKSLNENLYHDMFYSMPKVPRAMPGTAGVLARRIQDACI